MRIKCNEVKKKIMSTRHGSLIYLLIGKLLQLAVVLFIVSFVTFFLMSLAPGNPASVMYEAAGIVQTEEMVELVNEQLGVDKPFFERFGIWLSQCLKGDLGTSFSQHEEVSKLILRNLQPTIILAISILVVTLVVSIPLGIISAVKKNKFTDYLIRYTSFIGISSPNFLVALILTFIFSYKLKIFPVYNQFGTFQSMILPVCSLAIGMVADYTRQIRTLYLEELSKDYVYGARARGVSEIKILLVHVMRNVMIPLITIIAFSLGSLLGGVAVVEVIFSFKGLGNLIVFAVDRRDYPLIQGLVLWIAMCYTVLNILSDLLYKVFDPRLRKMKVK